MSVIKNKTFLYYLLIIILFYGAASVNSLYLPSMYQQEGLNVNAVTTVLFFCTMMEFVVVLGFGRYMNRISNRTLLVLSFVSLLIQFSIYSFVNITSIQIAATILTKSVTTMTFIMINLKVVTTIISESMQNTALAIVAAVQSLSSIIFQLIGGILIDSFSYQIFYLVLTITSLAGILISTRYRIADGNDLNLF